MECRRPGVGHGFRFRGLPDQQMQGEDASGVLEASRDLRKKIEKKSTSSTTHTELQLDSADRAVIVEGSTPAAEVTDASKVSFASNDVRGKLKKCEVEFEARQMASRSN